MLARKDHNDIAILSLEHGKANAFDLELAEAITRALDAIERDDATCATVITAKGRIFSAGVDLFRLLDGGPAYVDRFLPALIETFRRLFMHPKPVVAALNGHAIAGGCVLAAACDYRLMAAGDWTIGVPELRVGVPFPLVAIEILRFATSTARLQSLVYKGAVHGVEGAYERGLIDEIVNPPALPVRAIAEATRLSSEPAARFRITKQMLRQPAIERIDRLGREMDARVLAEWKRPETLAAIGKYVDRLRTERTPRGR